MPINPYGDIETDPYLVADQPDIGAEIDEYLLTGSDLTALVVEATDPKYTPLSYFGDDYTKYRDDYVAFDTGRGWELRKKELVLTPEGQALKDGFTASLTSYKDSMYQFREDTATSVAQNDLMSALYKLDELKMDAWAAKKQAEKSLGRGIVSSSSEDVFLDIERQTDLSASGVSSNIAKLKSGLDYNVADFRSSYNEDLWDVYSDFIKAGPTKGGEYVYSRLTDEDLAYWGDDDLASFRADMSEKHHERTREDRDRDSTNTGDRPERGRDDGPSSPGPASSIGVTEEWAMSNITAPIQNMFNSIVNDLEQEA